MTPKRILPALVCNVVLVETMACAEHLKFALSFDKILTCSTELAVNKLSVLYSKLPAQFFSLISGSRAKSGDMAGPATIAESSLIKLLLFMPKGQVALNLKFGWRNFRFWP